MDVPGQLPSPNPLPKHEAPLGLKIILLVFAIALVVGLGYLVWFQNNLPTGDTADIILKKPIKAATDLAPKNLAYVNSTYGFSVNFNSVWTGYKVKTVVPTDGSATAYLYVNLPTTSTDPAFTQEGTTNFAGYASVLSFNVYTPAQWATLTSSPSDIETRKLATSSHYVIDYNPADSYPTDLKTAFDDIATVVATFKLN